MAEILITAHASSDRGHPFAALADQPALRTRVERGMTRALSLVYQEDARRNGAEFARRVDTSAERRRRFAILTRWYGILTVDCRYSPQHALDELPRALRAELDGTPYTPPPANRLWSPASGG